MENKIHCLLIDDQPEEHELFDEALKQTNLPMVCEYAQYADAAFEKLTEPGKPLPQFIFIDLKLPRMSSRQFLEKLKGTQHLKDIPVYIYSVSHFPEYMREATEAGAAGYLVKPDGIDTLTGMLKQILNPA